MKDYQESFLKLAIKSKSLQFGEFTLKSGRSSPYFFNAANMLSSCSLYELAKCYVNDLKTDIFFENIIQNKKANFSRYNFFYANYLYNQNKFLPWSLTTFF